MVTSAKKNLFPWEGDVVAGVSLSILGTKLIKAMQGRVDVGPGQGRPLIGRF